jgi:hypothetical protein
MVIFCCGVVTGALVIKTELGRPAPPQNQGFRGLGGGPGSPAQLQNANLLRRMDKDLALNTNQHDHIEKIMHASQDRAKLLWNVIAPEMEKEVARMRGEIQSTLTPAQQKQFEAMLLSRPRRPEGSPSREGEPRYRGTNRIHTNGPPTNILPVSAPQNDGLTTNGP